MSIKGRTQEIQDVKQRSARSHHLLSWDLRGLRDRWRAEKELPGCTPDYFIIRAVTLLEVHARRNLAVLIDHDAEFTKRAVELTKTFKIDFEVVREIQWRTITVGDLVSHNVPLNNWTQILSHFSVVLGKDIAQLLKGARDRWWIEIGQHIATSLRDKATESGGSHISRFLEGGTDGPIISDFDELGRHLSSLFQTRHILCHEMPTEAPYSKDAVDALLDAAFKFSKALEEVLEYEKNGNVPLTQTGMNIKAGEELREADERLAELIKKIRDRVEGEPDWLKCLTDAQESWVAFRKQHCEFATFLNRGGSIRPLLFAGEATELTELRIDGLKKWLEMDEHR